MERLIINICASKDSFGAYSVNYDGIYAAGNSIEECKKDVYKAIELIKTNLSEDRWPSVLKGEYEIEWHYDVETLLQTYGLLLSLSGLEKITGIHQKQLWSYMHGKSKPRRQQIEKIEKGIKRFGKELAQISLIL